MKRTSKIRSFLTIIFMATFLAPQSAGALEQFKVHVSGGGTSPNSLVFKIGQEQGFYRQEGLEVLTVTARMQTGIQGLIANNFDASQILGAGAAAILRGAPLKIVMVFDTRPLWWLYGAKGIKSVQDLKGKVIGVSSLGAALAQMTREILPKYGLAPDRDVMLRDVGSASERVAALMTGVVDAAVLSAPGNLVAKKHGMNQILFYGDEADYVSGGVVVSQHILTERRDQLKRFLRGTLNAFYWYQSGKKEAVNYVRDALKISDSEAAEIYQSAMRGFSKDGTISRDLQKRVVELQKASLNVKDDVSLESVYDFDLLRALNREMSRK